MVKENLGEPPPFKSGDHVFLEEGFGNKIGGHVYIVETCKSDLRCQSGWKVYIDVWATGICSNWFKKVIE